MPPGRYAPAYDPYADEYAALQDPNYVPAAPVPMTDASTSNGGTYSADPNAPLPAAAPPIDYQTGYQAPTTAGYAPVDEQPYAFEGSEAAYDQPIGNGAPPPPAGSNTLTNNPLSTSGSMPFSGSDPALPPAPVAQEASPEPKENETYLGGINPLQARQEAWEPISATLRNNAGMDGIQTAPSLLERHETRGQEAFDKQGTTGTTDPYVGDYNYLAAEPESLANGLLPGRTLPIVDTEPFTGSVPDPRSAIGPIFEDDQTLAGLGDTLGGLVDGLDENTLGAGVSDLWDHSFGGVVGGLMDGRNPGEVVSDVQGLSTDAIGDALGSLTPQDALGIGMSVIPGIGARASRAMPKGRPVKTSVTKTLGSPSQTATRSPSYTGPRGERAPSAAEAEAMLIARGHDPATAKRIAESTIQVNAQRPGEVSPVQPRNQIPVVDDPVSYPGPSRVPRDDAAPPGRPGTAEPVVPIEPPPIDIAKQFAQLAKGAPRKGIGNYEPGSMPPRNPSSQAAQNAQAIPPRNTTPASRTIDGTTPASSEAVPGQVFDKSAYIRGNATGRAAPTPSQQAINAARAAKGRQTVSGSNSGNSSNSTGGPTTPPNPNVGPAPTPGTVTPQQPGMATRIARKVAGSPKKAVITAAAAAALGAEAGERINDRINPAESAAARPGQPPTQEESDATVAAGSLRTSGDLPGAWDDRAKEWQQGPAGQIYTKMQSAGDVDTKGRITGKLLESYSNPDPNGKRGPLIDANGNWLPEAESRIKPGMVGTPAYWHDLLPAKGAATGDVREATDADTPQTVAAGEAATGSGSNWDYGYQNGGNSGRGWVNYGSGGGGGGRSYGGGGGYSGGGFSGGGGVDDARSVLGPDFMAGFMDDFAFADMFGDGFPFGGSGGPGRSGKNASGRKTSRKGKFGRGTKTRRGKTAQAPAKKPKTGRTLRSTETDTA
jgi:hypothetical protein